MSWALVIGHGWSLPLGVGMAQLVQLFNQAAPDGLTARIHFTFLPITSDTLHMFERGCTIQAILCIVISNDSVWLGYNGILLQLKFGPKSKAKRESKVKSGYEFAGTDDGDLQKQIRDMSDKEVRATLSASASFLHRHGDWRGVCGGSGIIVVAIFGLSCNFMPIN